MKTMHLGNNYIIGNLWCHSQILSLFKSCQSIFRYDYENVDSLAAGEMMKGLQQHVDDSSLVGKEFSHGGKSFTVKLNDNFEYTDPIDHSVTKKQVIIETYWLIAFSLNLCTVRYKL